MYLSYLFFYFISDIYWFKNLSFYLNYLISLNYWTFNTLFLLLFIGVFFFSMKIKVFYLFIIIKICFKNYFLKFLYKKKFVSALWVGTVVIHPLLFYFTLITLSLMVFFVNSSLMVQKTYKSKFFYIKTFILALSLGGLWGLQSFTWGYFWVNDGIEWNLVLLITYFCILLHIKSGNSYILLNFTLFILLFLLFAIRINIVATRHSFLSSISFIIKLLLMYYFFNKVFNKFFLKKNIIWNLSFFYFIIFITSFYSVAPCLIVYKLICYCFVFLVFYYYKLFYFSFFYFVSHYFLFLYFFLWLPYFNYFFLLIDKLSFIDFELNSIYIKVFSFNNLEYTFQKLALTILEEVNFVLNTYFNQFQNFFFVYSYKLIVNCIDCLLLLYVLFL